MINHEVGFLWPYIFKTSFARERSIETVTVDVEADESALDGVGDSGTESVDASESRMRFDRFAGDGEGDALNGNNELQL